MKIKNLRDSVLIVLGPVMVICSGLLLFHVGCYGPLKRVGAFRKPVKYAADDAGWEVEGSGVFDRVEYVRGFSYYPKDQCLNTVVYWEGGGTWMFKGRLNVSMRKGLRYAIERAHNPVFYYVGAKPNDYYRFRRLHDGQ